MPPALVQCPAMVCAVHATTATFSRSTFQGAPLFLSISHFIINTIHFHIILRHCIKWWDKLHYDVGMLDIPMSESLDSFRFRFVSIVAFVSSPSLPAIAGPPLDILEWE